MNKKRFQKGIADFQREASGMLAMFVATEADLFPLLVDTLAGDELAGRLARCVVDTISQIESAPRHQPILCASCPRPVRGTAYFIVLALPGTGMPRRGLGHAVCPRCAKTRDEAEEKALVAIQKIWPDLRKIRVTHPEGGVA
jgi:hypothetical protein